MHAATSEIETNKTNQIQQPEDDVTGEGDVLYGLLWRLSSRTALRCCLAICFAFGEKRGLLINASRTVTDLSFANFSMYSSVRFGFSRKANLQS